MVNQGSGRCKQRLEWCLDDVHRYLGPGKNGPGKKGPGKNGPR